MTRIFISCVTAEFGAYRVQIAEEFRRADFDVKFQEEFPQVAEGTIRKLDAIIRSCEKVIHILGRGLGTTADSIAVAEYLNHEPKFLTAMQAVGDFRTLQLSYTQWEAYLAAYHNKPLFIYEAEFAIRDGHPTLSSGCDKDWPVFEPNPNDADLVLAHRERLSKLPTARYPISFRDLARLMGKFLGDLPEIRLTATKAAVSINLRERFGQYKLDELKNLLRTTGEPLLKDGFFLAAFVQITNTTPEKQVRNKDRKPDVDLVDALAESTEPYELLGLVKACQTRSKASNLNELTTSLESWFADAIKAFNKTQLTRADKLTEKAVTNRCGEALDLLIPDNFPTPSLELAWQKAPADPQKRVFAEGYLRWGRHRSKLSLKGDTSILANEVPTRFMAAVQYLQLPIEWLGVFVSESELHHPWEYKAGCKPDDEYLLLHRWPVVLRLLHREIAAGSVKPPPDLVKRHNFACRLSPSDSFMADVRARGGFFTMPINPEDGAQIISQAATRASFGFWLRHTKPIEVAEKCFDELDGLTPASVPRWVLEKKRDSPKGSPWRDVAILYDHPKWPDFTFSSDSYDPDDVMRTDSQL